MAQNFQGDSCETPNLADILSKVSRMQGMILKNYLLEEKITAIRTSLIELEAEQSRVTAMIALKESQLEQLVEQASEVQCELGYAKDRD